MSVLSQRYGHSTSCQACGGHGYHGESTFRQTCAACDGSGQRRVALKPGALRRKRGAEITKKGHAVAR